MWTDRVKGIKSSELKQYITDTYGDAFVKSANISWKEYVARCDAIQLFLRQGFVLPEKDIFYTNPTDAGRFMNHSSNPNCGPDGTLRDIQSGEELTMDYSFHGNPTWYQELCKEYGVETEAEVAKKTKESRFEQDLKEAEKGKASSIEDEIKNKPVKFSDFKGSVEDLLANIPDV